MLTRNWGKEYFNTPGGDINYSKHYKPQYGISLGEKKTQNLSYDPVLYF